MSCSASSENRSAMSSSRSNRLAPPSPAAASRRRRGLTRMEAIWLALLAVAVVFAILGSLKADRDARRLRQAQDGLQYLKGQFRYALEQAPDGGSAWPATLHGPGDPPAELESATALREVLVADAFVPTDPWGRAYVAERTAPGRWALWCAGAAGARLALDDAEAVDAAEERGLHTAVAAP